MNHLEPISGANGKNFDLVCFSHLRWDFVFQRPQHLMTRAARNRRVFVIEEPIFSDDLSALKVASRGENLFVLTPSLNSTGVADVDAAIRKMIDEFFISENIETFVSWYYTPMMLGWSAHLKPLATIYDCMDELSAFKNAPAEVRERESNLFDRADVVFTGGHSLYEAKKTQHENVYAFPSSIDVSHFSKALGIVDETPDQEGIAFPRIGFVGVIDERLDIELLAEVADLKPDFQFIMIGPVVKIDERDLPRRPNIHYLGGKDYSELPSYLSGWQAAMMPFAINESTKFISPTKTPEYLAAGLQVISTPIRDVVNPYGDEKLVYIASTAEEFAAAIDRALSADLAEHRERAAEFLSDISWDKTFAAMSDLVERAIEGREQPTVISAAAREA